MKGKIIPILVMTLLITAGTIVVADWSPGDGHKMHDPQQPDPYGVDVDWVDWYLGDDWECSETGKVTDIHFWYSWKGDNEHEIPTIDVSIWSNDPGPPSLPKTEEWQRILYYPDDFVIASYGYGNQGWYNPKTGYYIENDHTLYYQINIMDIDEPLFEQVEGETYWLVIKMPYDEVDIIGWKNSTSIQFKDTAVYGWPPTSWTPFKGPDQQNLDLAFVITGEDGGQNNPPYEPNIDGLTEIIHGIIYPYDFVTIDPEGDQVSYYTEWGDGTASTWSPFQESGEIYTRSHIWLVPGDYTIRAKAKDPDDAESGWGELRITVPRNKAIMSSLFYHLLEQFPILSWFFQRLICLQ